MLSITLILLLAPSLAIIVDRHCAWTDPASKTHYDFTALHGHTLKGHDISGQPYSYLFNPCGIASGPCASRGAMIAQIKDNVCVTPISYWRGMNWAKTSEGVEMTIRNGPRCRNGNRQARVHFICDHNAKHQVESSGTDFTVSETPAHSCKYDLRIPTALACSGAASAVFTSGGHGSRFWTFALVVIAGYVVVGCAYNRKVLNKRWEESFPHGQLWASLFQSVWSKARSLAGKKKVQDDYLGL